MEAYGYKVTGSAAVLKDIAEIVKSKNMWINSKPEIFTGRETGTATRSI